jgi:hypothetical protein
MSRKRTAAKCSSSNDYNNALFVTKAEIDLFLPFPMVKSSVLTSRFKQGALPCLIFSLDNFFCLEVSLPSLFRLFSK